MISIDCKEGESLLEAMRRQGLSYRAECGGRGTCGKCRIRVIAGELEIIAQDRRLFSEEELEQGLRLSCKAYPKEYCTIELLAGYETNGYDIVTELKNRKTAVLPRESTMNSSEINILSSEEGYLIAIDLGTTTLAFSLIESVSVKVIRTHTAMNPQRAYGTDVITRIKAAGEGKLNELKDMIRKELYQGIITLTSMEEVDLHNIRRIAIAGNTTMGHLLLGYDCGGLGVYPFTPVDITTITMDFAELFPSQEHIPVVVLPGISAFVGGDITAGLLACGCDRTERMNLIVDLGTNGEMALGNKNRLLVTSTAAGPAFEGGNISCGVGSIPGAITHVTIEAGACRYETIGDNPPVGICGTGVIEIVSELLKTGQMDETGLLAEPFFEQGYGIGKLTFTQKDVRELQLAKAAVRAGIETLIQRYGISYDEIDKVYLAGGFGYKMDILKAVHIGLLPPELTGKVEAVGNSSLSGAIEYLTDRTAEARVRQILAAASEIHLSNDKDFNDYYIEYMSF
jgi:uncharacterized 2Fe-2S/4Fe-4S cluster protein (DUF4445 family)